MFTYDECIQYGCLIPADITLTMVIEFTEFCSFILIWLKVVRDEATLFIANHN